MQAVEIPETAAGSSGDTIEDDEDWMALPVPSDSEGDTVESDGAESPMMGAPPTKKLKICDEAISTLVHMHKILKPVVYDLPRGCPKFGIFVSLYGGVGHVAEAALELDRTSLLYDMARDPMNNLTLTAANKDIHNLLMSKAPGSERSLVRCLGIDLPCSTWSLARGGGGGPPAVRDSGAHLFGFTRLRPCDLKKVDDANMQVDRACEAMLS